MPPALGRSRVAPQRQLVQFRRSSSALSTRGWHDAAAQKNRRVQSAARQPQGVGQFKKEIVRGHARCTILPNTNTGVSLAVVALAVDASSSSLHRRNFTVCRRGSRRAGHCTTSAATTTSTRLSFKTPAGLARADDGPKATADSAIAAACMGLVVAVRPAYWRAADRGRPRRCRPSPQPWPRPRRPP
jgi:hypothetical protein